MIRPLLAALALLTAATLPDAAQPVSARVRHGMGLRVRSLPYISPSRQRSITLHAGALPASIDLRQFAPPVRDQGDTGSCASQATTELADWYLYRAGIGLPDGLAPMYLYSQIVRQDDGGQDAGSYFETNGAIAAEQGLVPLDQYSLGAQAGMTDWRDLPNASDHQIAGQHRFMSNFRSTNTVSLNAASNDDALKAALASRQQPVLLAIYANDAGFMGATGSAPIPGFWAPVPDHAVLALAYDSAGNVLVENSWGTAWGFGGYAWLSPSFIQEDVADAWIADASVSPSPSTPTPSPTVLPAETPTGTPVRPTASPVPIATDTPSPTAVPPTVIPTRPIPTLTPRPDPAPQPTATVPAPPIPPTSTPRPHPTSTPQPCITLPIHFHYQGGRYSWTLHLRQGTDGKWHHAAQCPR